MNRIAIMGAGWLGRPLGQALVKQGHLVNASTTSPEKMIELKADGMAPYLIKAEASGITGTDVDDFFDAEVLILNIPPGGRRNPNVEQDHPRQIQQILAKATKSGVQKLVFISSTSVYGNTNERVTEETPTQPSTASGRALVAAEQLVQQQSGANTIVRMSGLVGGERQAGRFFAGKKEVPNGSAPINFIHRKDAVQVILAILEQKAWGEIFNACADEHPEKAVFYAAQAKKQGYEPPTFLPGKSNYKTISNQKLKQQLGYKFAYPNPMEF